MSNVTVTVNDKLVSVSKQTPTAY